MPASIHGRGRGEEGRRGMEGRGKSVAECIKLLSNYDCGEA